ncbi:hypothetical protein BLNAU_7213 [Blattamonas nauphoetae]|uniref:Uncharacterized protein n=1 Tax=Blattamonas nauphoetae TaxID=2049346 RepID=A0ABQ9Y217_9EUKA|nr:hypothetical protein BLNAU_7213 [Blattamonas nauphoetae]
MLTLHEISCESDDQGLMSDCLTMRSNLFINSFVPFFGNAALCLDNLNELRASPSSSLLAIAVFCGGLTVLFDCIHLLSGCDEDVSSSKGHREHQVLMRVWLAVVNVFHLSLHSGSEGRHSAAAEIDAGEYAEHTTRRGVGRDRPTARIGGADCGAEGQKDDTSSEPRDGAAVVDCEHFRYGKRSRHVALNHPEPKWNRVRSEDVCQLGASPGSERAERVAHAGRVDQDTTDAGRAGEGFGKDEEDKEENEKDGKEEEAAEGAPTEDTSRTESNSHVVDHVSPIRHADTQQARPRRLPNINNAGLALVEIVSAAVRLNNWAVAQDAHDRAGAATRKRRGADGVAHLGVTQADRERCRELRYTEPVVEKETDEDTIAELAERLQVELTLHALLAELNTIDLTTVLSKTQVLSALSLLYLAASSPVGAAKPRQLNG